VDLAREEGIKVGILRLIVVWPFPENRVRELARKVKSIVVPEINYGQVAYEVDRCVGGQAEVALSAHGGGWVHNPESILYTIRQAAQGKRVGEGVVEYHRKKRG
jgi:2-oxoglutarate ferredoxin oxidoreductase subunit alpha